MIKMSDSTLLKIKNLLLVQIIKRDKSIKNPIDHLLMYQL